MRLKSLRKERPAFENEGAVINGNRMDISTNVLKPTKYRPNTSFSITTSQNFQSSSRIFSASDARSRQFLVIPTGTQPVSLPTYQDIEAAYLEHGIRIRVAPMQTNQPSGGEKSPLKLQRHSAFVSRNPTRTSSVLHYNIANLNEPHHARPFSALHQTSSNDFEQNQTHNVSYVQPSQVNEEIPPHPHENYFSPSIVLSEHSNPTTPEKVSLTNNATSSAGLFENDPDLAYMSTLLRKQNGDAFRDIIRRRAGLRPTLSAYRNSIPTSLGQTLPRDKTPPMHRPSSTRSSTNKVLAPPSPEKIEKDIIKHAARIRGLSASKDQLNKSTGVDTTPLNLLSPRTNDSHNNNNKQQSVNKPLKSLSLEPLAFLLAPGSRSNSLTTQDLPSVKQPTKPRKSKRSRSAKILPLETPPVTDSFSKDNYTSSSILNDESLSLMRTSPLDIAQQSSSFDSGYDHSSSGDMQSLTSSSIMQIPSSLHLKRINNSVLRRSHPNSNKKVSFYDEAKAIVVTTATYV